MIWRNKMLTKDNIQASAEKRKNSLSIMFKNVQSVEDGCEKIAGFLKLDKPVNRDVFISVVEDTTYAGNIMMTRNTPTFLNYLLENPSRLWTEAETDVHDTAKVIERSNVELLRKAAQSLLVWSGSGAQVVDDETYKRRLAACETCPHYIEPPKKLIYKAVSLLSKGKSRKICNLCGCVSINKAKLATESCSDSHTDLPGYTRWGEQI